MDQDAAVRARRDGDDRGKVDRRGHHKTVAVVGVLADQVDAAGRGVERAGNIVGGEVKGGNFSVGRHGLFLRLQRIGDAIPDTAILNY